MAVVCTACGRERVRRWQAMREQNGLTEAEWPKPKPPEFRTRADLLLHRLRQHR